jgi:hypothetical protein
MFMIVRQVPRSLVHASAGDFGQRPRFVQRGQLDEPEVLAELGPWRLQHLGCACVVVEEPNDAVAHPCSCEGLQRPEDGSGTTVDLQAVLRRSADQGQRRLHPVPDHFLHAAVGHGTFTSPVNGQSVASIARQFTWATVPGAQGYVLAAGTTTYGTDLVNSGVLLAAQSSFRVPPLPKGKTLHASLLTKVNGAFTRSQTIVFTES